MFFCIVLSLCGLWMTEAATVASSMFSQTSEGWSTIDINGMAGSVSYSSASVTASDTNNLVWWFTAPAAFVGVQTGVYNGKLSFTLGSDTYDMAGKPAIVSDDVVLVSQCGHMLSKRGIITPGTTNQYQVLLNEDGWIDSRTNGHPNVFDFLGVLNNLAAINIRGSFYVGAETSRLSSVTLTAGATAWYPCCTMSGDVDICAKPASPYFNPAHLKFYCEGSQKKLISVSNIYPRFSRRSGGTYITLSGANFGMAGSNPLVRVNGVPCEENYYLHSAGTVPEDNLGPVQETQVVCKTPQGDGSDLSVTVEAASGGKSSPYDVRWGNLHRAWVQESTTSESCIGENNRGFVYGGHEYAWSVQIKDNGATPSATMVDSAVAVDESSGDIYLAGTLDLTVSTTYTIVSRSAPKQQQTTITCMGSLSYCGFVARLDKEGKVLWVATADTATGGASGKFRVTDVAIDMSGVPYPRVYITGSVSMPATVAGTTTAFTPQLTGPGGSTVITGNPIADPAAGTVQALMIGQFDISGSPKWMNLVYRCSDSTYPYNCPIANQQSTEYFSLKPRLAVYRPSTASIVDQQTKGDYASYPNYILGTPRDNGGVYVTGTIYSTAAVNSYSIFSQNINPAYKPTAASTTAPTVTTGDYVQLGVLSTAVATVGYLVKYDDAGNAQWVRVFGAAGTVALNQYAIPTITSVAASNDAIFISGTIASTAYTTANQVFINYDTCAWQTLTTGMGSSYAQCQDLTARANLVDFGATTVTSASLDWGVAAQTCTFSFIVAYDAAGEVRWHKELLRDTVPKLNTGLDIEVTGLAFLRPQAGGDALTGNMASAYDYSLAGTGQNSISSFSNGFYLCVAGHFKNDGTVTSFLGKQLQFSLSNAKYNTFVFKLNTADGSAQWVSYYGDGTGDLKVTDVVADDLTGGIYVIGTGASVTGMSTCAVAGNDCGTDAFSMLPNLQNRAGCMVDFRALTGTVTNADYGKPRCKFTSYVDNANSGFIFKVADAVYDSKGRVISQQPVDTASIATTSARPSVHWVKTFGISTAGTSQTYRVAIGNSAIVIIGSYASQTALTFPNLADSYANTATLLVKLTE